MRVSDKLFAKIVAAKRAGIELRRLEVTNDEADHLLAECGPLVFDAMAAGMKFHGIPLVIVECREIAQVPA